MAAVEAPSTTSPEERKNWWFRLGGWIEERSHLYEGLLPIIQHPVPKAVNWWYVFGSATLIAFLVQVFTGVALALTYIPSTDSAYQTLQYISHGAPWGNILRGMHYFGASAMVVLISAHVLRVFLMGSFKFPREFNWVTGAFLLVFTAAMAFTGQLLRWDQNGYWSVVVMAEQAGRTPVIGKWVVYLVLGGNNVGGATLTRFFGVHVFLLPAAIFTFIFMHLWLVVFDGISEPPVAGVPVDPATYRERYHHILEHEGVPFFPDAVWKDALFGLLVVGTVMVLAAFVGAPELGKLADPTLVQANPRPDWYFNWYFAVLSMIPPQLEDWVIILVPVLIGVLVLSVPFISNRGERHFSRRPAAMVLVGGMLVSLVALTYEGANSPWSPDISASSANNVPIPASIEAQAEKAGPDAVAGSNLFITKGCHTCHMLAGTGGQKGPDLTHIGSALSSEEMVARVLNGAPNMPAFSGNMTQQEIQQLVDFLQTLK